VTSLQCDAVSPVSVGSTSVGPLPVLALAMEGDPKPLLETEPDGQGDPDARRNESTAMEFDSRESEIQHAKALCALSPGNPFLFTFL
jgi:hypothetical protein